MATPIEQRGYAHPDALVSNDWVEQHLNDPKVGLIESNEDTLLYASGHVPGAVLIPLGILQGKSESLSKDKPIVTVCRSGARSAQATVLLGKAGFGQVANLSGGMLRWRAQRFAVEGGSE